MYGGGGVGVAVGFGKAVGFGVGVFVGMDLLVGTEDGAGVAGIPVVGVTSELGASEGASVGVGMPVPVEDAAEFSACRKSEVGRGIFSPAELSVGTMSVDVSLLHADNSSNPMPISIIIKIFLN